MTALPVLCAAYAAYLQATEAWRAAGEQGARPRLVLPVDQPRPTWPGLLAARATYRAAMQRVAAHWATLDVFDVPSLQRADIRAADWAIQAAFAARDGVRVARAVAAWERAICGEAFVVRVCTR